ncbi:hypothetical protein NQZ68_027258 [Dissostichus eleginoides]|nr:hypothetical protein NQZ68_027258 [Dissostichus eleginoides]
MRGHSISVPECQVDCDQVWSGSSAQSEQREVEQEKNHLCNLRLPSAKNTTHRSNRRIWV